MGSFLRFVLSGCIVFSSLQAGAGQDPSPGGQSSPAKIRVLVVYHSRTGNTEKMAGAVAEGATKVSGATVMLRKVAEVTEDDLESADAVLMGSPTYYGDMSGTMKTFIDDWLLKYHVDLVDKVGGAFSSGGGVSGGKEHVLGSLVIAMLNAGMVVAGPVQKGYGNAGVAALDPVTESALEECRGLGERAARIALRLKPAKGG
jgi:NAD(P)H dehydrogenase (quinone)